MSEPRTLTVAKPLAGLDNPRLSERERTTANELKHLDPQLAGLYEHGIALLDRIEEPGMPYLIAHAGRELSLGIVRLIGGVDADLFKEKNADVEKGQHRAKIASVLQLPPEHSSVITWLQVHRTFAKNAHHRQPGPNPEEIRETFERLSGLLFGIIAPYFETQDELDALLAVESPSPSDAERLTRCLLRPRQRTYFFSHLQYPGWLTMLRAMKIFSNPPDRAVDEEAGTWRMRPWPEGDYLVRVAASEPQLVTDILASLPQHLTNPAVWDIVAQAALLLPTPHAKRLVPSLRTALAQVPPFIFPRTLIKLVRVLAEAGDSDAFLLTEDLLFIASPPSDNSVQPPQGRGYRNEWMLARLEFYNLKEFLSETLPTLEALDAERTLSVLLGKLERATRLGASKAARGFLDTRFWCLHLDKINIDGDVRAQLAQAATAIALRLVERDAETAERVAEMLDGREHDIFTRIQRAVLATAGRHLRGRLDTFLASSDAIDPSFGVRESASVLRAQFENASPSAQLVFRYALERGPAPKLVTGKLSHGNDEVTEESMGEVIAAWQRRRLRRFQDRIPPLLRDLADVLGVEGAIPSEEEQALDEDGFYSGTATWSGGDRSPTTVDELASHPPERMAEYLITWQPKAPGKMHEGPTIRGLQRTVTDYASDDPASAVAVAEHLMARPDVAPGYVEAILAGFRKALEADHPVLWPAALRLVERVFTASGIVDGADSHGDRPWLPAISEAIDLVQEGCSGDHIPASEVDPVWVMIDAVLRAPLTWSDTRGFSDAFGDQFYGVLTAALNTLAGDATHALLAAALWTYRFTISQAGEDATPSPATVDAAKAAATSRLIPLVEHVLAQSGPSGLAAHSMLGNFVPQLHLLARQWLLNAGERLFANGATDPLHYPIWGSYITRGRYYDDLFRDLRPWYVVAAGAATPEQSDDAHEREWSLTKFLTEHVLIAMLRGLVAPGDSDLLLETTYERVPVAERVHTYWSVWRDRRNDAEATPDEFIERILSFWSWRLDVLEQKPASPARLEELKGLNWFLRTPNLPDEEVLRLGQRTVALADGEIASHNASWERLAELAEVDAATTFELVERIVRANLRQEHPYLVFEEVAPIFRAALASDAQTVHERATRLIHQLGEQGFGEFGRLLDNRDEKEE